MSQPIQLLPGLTIRFGPDGTWMNFDAEDNAHRGMICLENTLVQDRVVGEAVQGWIARMRKTPLTQEPPQGEP